MSIRKLKTVEAAWDESIYTQDALDLDPLAKDLASTVDAILARYEVVVGEQRKARRNVLRAQAIFSDVNYRADSGVTAFAWDLEHAAGGQGEARFKRYFVMAPSRLVKRALAAMGLRMKGWLTGIRAEPEAEVSRHGDTLEGLANEALGAVEGLAVAKGAAATTKSQVIDDYLDDVNAFRMDLHGELLKRAAANKKSAEWVAKFFRPAEERNPPDAPDGGTPPASPVDA